MKKIKFRSIIILLITIFLFWYILKDNFVKSIDLIASSNKARKILGWKPEHAELEEIIATAWNWHKKHPNGYNDK